jgi:deazaflavin-dependent oxidoreductase (nitroreductase family)
MEKIKNPQPPRGLSRLAFRLPIWLYRWGLGWMLGQRFLMLTHIGRKSGLPRQTVLEVVKPDPEHGTYYVASGFGEKSDWYRNVMVNPDVTIQVGKKRYPAQAKRLSKEEAVEVLLDYARRHPATLHELASFMGYRIDDTEEDYRALGQALPIIALRYDHSE